MKRRLWWLVGLFAALGSVLAAAGSASAATEVGFDSLGVFVPGS